MMAGFTGLLLAFLFGTVVGSFLNVVSLRLHSGVSLGGRSFCFSCGKKLNWFELVPLFSFLVQSGRCRGCGARISPQYPLIEGLTGLVFASVFYKFAVAGLFDIPGFVLALTFFSFFIVLIPYDLRHLIVPNEFVYPLIGISVVSLFLGEYPSFPPTSYLLSGPIVALLPFCLHFFSKGRWIGFGDIKLFLAAGWFLPFPQAVSAFLLSFWIGAAFSVLLILRKSAHLKTAVPFGPFIFAGVFLAFVLRLDIVHIADLLSSYGS